MELRGSYKMESLMDLERVREGKELRFAMQAPAANGRLSMTQRRDIFVTLHNSEWAETTQNSLGGGESYREQRKSKTNRTQEIQAGV